MEHTGKTEVIITLKDYLTSVAAGLAVLRVTCVRAVHTGAQGCQSCRCLFRLLLFGLRALVVTVTFAQVIKAKVFDLVATLAGHATFGTLFVFLVLFVFKAKKLQLGLRLGLLGLCLCGSEPEKISLNGLCSVR